MEIEFMYDKLFLVTNGLISLVNMVLLFITFKRFKAWLMPPGDHPEEHEHKTEKLNERKISVRIRRNRRKDAGDSILMSMFTEKRLLQELEKATEELFFIKKTVSLKDLAGLLCTNQRYVSYILKKHKKLDFTSFVQQCRVDYFIKLVGQNPDLLNENMAVLASKVGFSSFSKFSTVFKAQKGITPLEYFQTLRAKR
ncbi:helix-turn-helix domain-containing protein [Sphingobacterium kitahiroshimense]|uniref:Helix-turn-helix domain-containing protein n=1 Tax=Sphingobacterium kitahiroshimense TaxID=470446 RepID=A0ABV0BWV2_9SPHI